MSQSPPTSKKKKKKVPPGASTSWSSVDTTRPSPYDRPVGYSRHSSDTGPSASTPRAIPPLAKCKTEPPGTSSSRYSVDTARGSGGHLRLDGAAASGENTMYLALDTTGFKSTRYITRITARMGNRTFCRYVLPPKSIEEGAIEKSGLYYDEDSPDSPMTDNGTPVDTVPLRDALLGFLGFLGDGPDRILVLCHGYESYQRPILYDELQRCELHDQVPECHRFLDTSRLFQEYQNKNWDQVLEQQEKFSLEYLYQKHCGKSVPAPLGATNASKCLQEVIEKSRILQDPQAMAIVEGRWSMIVA